MDPLDRLFRHLVRTIRANYPQYLSQPFEVAELYQTIMPYRHNRRELSLDTNQDYEMTLLELLSGARGYLVVEDKMRDTLTRELASPNPDPGSFREFAEAHVALAPDAVQKLEASGELLAGAAPRTSGSGTGSQRVSATRPSLGAAAVATEATPATAGNAGATARASSPVAAAPRTSREVAAGAEESCRYCGGALPQGRRVVFCPHCGQNLTVVNCLACGTELELGWRFCTSCGRPTASAGSG